MSDFFQIAWQMITRHLVKSLAFPTSRQTSMRLEKGHQNWKFKRICMPQLISAQKFLPFLLEKSFISATVSALYLHSFRKHKINYYLFHSLISFPSYFQDDFNLENVKHFSCTLPVYSNLSICAWVSNEVSYNLEVCTVLKSVQASQVYVNACELGKPVKSAAFSFHGTKWATRAGKVDAFCLLWKPIETQDSLYFACSWSQL